MGIADFFAGPALRARIEELDTALTETRKELDIAREEAGRLKTELTERSSALKGVREQHKAAQKKADKLAGNRNSTAKKATGLAARVEELEAELSEFRRAMLAAKDDAETQRVARMEVERKLELAGNRSSAPRPAPTEDAPRPPRERRPVDPDIRVERLERLLEEIRDSERGLKDRVAKAEKTARDAQHKLGSEVGKTDAVLRDLQHNLKSERTAYRILQQQFEMLVDRTKAAEAGLRAQHASQAARPATAPVPEATPESPTVPPASAEPKKSLLPDSWGKPGTKSPLSGWTPKAVSKPSPAADPEPAVAAEPEPSAAELAAAEPAAAEPAPAAEPEPAAAAEPEATPEPPEASSEPPAASSEPESPATE